MSENPYEAPQTIDKPPPLAEEVQVITVDFAALAEAAKGCSRAGMCYLVAALLTASEFVGASLMPREMYGTFWILFLFAPFVLSLFFGFAGVFLNTQACRRFKLELSDSKLKKLYASCQRASWLKAVLIVYLPCIPIVSHTAGQPGRGYADMWNLLMFFVPAIVLLINSVVTVIQHFRGINELGELMRDQKADHLATLYLFSGVPTTLIVVVILILSLVVSQRDFGPPPLLLAVVPVLLLPMFAAYQAAYRRLHQAFLARSKPR